MSLIEDGIVENKHDKKTNEEEKVVKFEKRKFDLEV